MFSQGAPASEVGYVEERTDVYRVGVGRGYGVKQRGGYGSTLELKTLVDERGGAEKWTKCRVEETRLAGHIPGYDATRVHLVRVAKRRFYTTLSAVRGGGGSEDSGAGRTPIEVVNITLDPPPPTSATWVSYCVEGGDVSHGASLKEVFPHGVVGGYPTWLEQLYAR